MLEPFGHRGDGERRRVRRKHALGGNDLLQFAERLPLHVELFEDRLDREVAVLELLVRGRALGERSERDGVLRIESAPCGRRREVVADRLQRVVDDLLLEIAKHHGHAEPPEEKRRELRRHQPGAGDADLVHLARLGRRPTGSAARAALDEVERVQRRLRLGREEEVGESLLLGPVALLEAPARGAFDEVERSVRRRCGSVERVVELPAALHDGLGEAGKIGLFARQAARRRSQSPRRSAARARPPGRRARARAPEPRSASCSGASG